MRLVLIRDGEGVAEEGGEDKVGTCGARGRFCAYRKGRVGVVPGLQSERERTEEDGLQQRDGYRLLRGSEEGEDIAKSQEI